MTVAVPFLETFTLDAGVKFFHWVERLLADATVASGACRLLWSAHRAGRERLEGVVRVPQSTQSYGGPTGEDPSPVVAAGA